MSGRNCSDNELPKLLHLCQDLAGNLKSVRELLEALTNVCDSKSRTGLGRLDALIGIEKAIQSNCLKRSEFDPSMRNSSPEKSTGDRLLNIIEKIRFWETNDMRMKMDGGYSSNDAEFETAHRGYWSLYRGDASDNYYSSDEVDPSRGRSRNSRRYDVEKDSRRLKRHNRCGSRRRKCCTHKCRSKRRRSTSTRKSNGRSCQNGPLDRSRSKRRNRSRSKRTRCHRTCSSCSCSREQPIETEQFKCKTHSRSSKEPNESEMKTKLVNESVAEIPQSRTGDEVHENSFSTSAQDGQFKDGNGFEENDIEDSLTKLSTLLFSALDSQIPFNGSASEFRPAQMQAMGGYLKESVENVQVTGHETDNETLQNFVSRTVSTIDKTLPSSDPDLDLLFDLDSFDFSADMSQCTKSSSSDAPNAGKASVEVIDSNHGKVPHAEEQIPNGSSIIDLNSKRYSLRCKPKKPTASDWNFKFQKKPARQPVRHQDSAVDIHDATVGRAASQPNENLQMVERSNNSTGCDTPKKPGIPESSVTTLANYMSPDQFSSLLEFVKQMQPCRPLQGSSNRKSTVQTNPIRSRSPCPTTQPGSVGAKMLLLKNIHPEWHSLSTYSSCMICNKSEGKHLVNHLVNCHPDSEVVLSRLPPQAALSLRLHPGRHNCKIVRNTQANTPKKYKQLCYFCNTTRCHRRSVWTQHMSRHTGYYRYRCNHCSKWSVVKPSEGECHDANDFEEIQQPQYLTSNLFAFVCDLCNFVRFQKHEIENHLTEQHDDDATKFMKVKFLSFPDK